MAYEGAMNGEMFFTAFRPFLLGDVGFANSVLNNTVNYMIIISTIAGVYCAYVLASLCIDMAIRAVKLGYLELIAPLPIMTLIIPGKDGVFKAWIKKTGSCAFEVFTRLFIVSFVIYLIRTIPQLFTATSFSYGGCTTSFGIITALLIRALVYCGLLTFLKQAPKFLSEATGIKSDGFKLGIASKLADSGLFTALGAAGGAVTAGVRNLAPGVHEAKGFVNKARVAASNLPSGVAGFASGAARGFKGAKDAKKWSDVSSAAGKAADDAIEAKLKRQDYRDAHGGTVSGAIGGHIQDTIDTVKDYPNSHRANYNYENKKHQSIDNIIKADSAIDDKVKAFMDKYSDDMTFNGKKLSIIRKDEESVNSTLQGLNQERARIIAMGGDTTAIDNEIDNYQQKSRDAHKATTDAEKAIKCDIKRGTYDTQLNSKELGDLKNLFIDYHTALKDNISSLSSDAALYDYASQILKQTGKPEDFRAVINRSEVKEHGNPSNVIQIKFVDRVKDEDTNVVRKMNQEGAAARKQQEGKK